MHVCINVCVHVCVFVQACHHGHVQHLEHLLFYGANMSAQNASGNTALHICALYNQVSPVYVCVCVAVSTQIEQKSWLYFLQLKLKVY